MLVPIPGTERGFELHGERATPLAPCVKCGARALPGLETCGAHTMRVDCAWCKETLREGAEPISHGICVPCKARAFPEAA